MRISRRAFLLLGVAGAAHAQLPPNIGEIRKKALDEAMRKVVGNAQVRHGRVKLDIPPLIDNGNAVPLSVEVESPMTAADHVKAIHVFTERNPQPYVLTVHLGPRAGRARISTRARIADTGAVTAIAQLSDGSFWSDSVKVVVTLSACLEEGLI
ncbi:MAG: SoxY-related AACIE arm protein [Burkholderiales bacterium]